MNKLNYALKSSRSPLETNRPVTLTITATAATAGNLCNRILFTFKKGDTAECLSVNDPQYPIKIGTNNTNWTPNIQLDVEDSSAVNCIVTNNTTSKEVPNPVEIYLNFTVSGGAGPASFSVWDDSSDKKVFTLQKVQAEFYLKNFIARKSDSAKVPKTEFGNGEAIYFSWESNGSGYELYNGREDGPIYSGPDTFYLMDPGITRDMTFILAAMKKDVAGVENTGTDVCETELRLYDKLPVTVTGADLNLKTLNVTGDSTLSKLNAASLSPKNTDLSINGNVLFSGISDFSSSNSKLFDLVDQTIRQANIYIDCGRIIFERCLLTCNYIYSVNNDGIIFVKFLLDPEYSESNYNLIAKIVSLDASENENKFIDWFASISQEKNYTYFTFPAVKGTKLRITIGTDSYGDREPWGYSGIYLNLCSFGKCDAHALKYERDYYDKKIIL